MSEDDNSKLAELNRRLNKTLDDERDAARKKRHDKGYRTARENLEDLIEAATAEAFKKMGAAHHQVDTTRHPAMHKTNTIDYIILLKGDVTLLLDEEEVDLKPFDVVVQRGTNHAWVNNGTDTALFIAVLIDSDLKE